MTISYNQIGNNGRLGNQMFQYAALKGISVKHGYSYSIPSKELMLTTCFQIPKTADNNNTLLYAHNIFEYNQKIIDECPDNVDLCGYFQSERYFKHIEDDIREDFTFYENIWNPCYSYIKGMFGSDVISLHVRRTDFLTDVQFYSLDMNYYNSALDNFSKDLPVMVVSDDPQWCKNMFKDDRFFISTSENMYIDLCLMSLCNYHIIANSTLSWWGSWLSESKKTIAPKQWFNPNGKYNDWSTENLYLEKWQII